MKYNPFKKGKKMTEQTQTPEAENPNTAAQTEERAENTPPTLESLQERIAELEGQLLLYTLPEWEKVEEKLVKLPSFDPQIRRLKRLYMGNAAECELDSTGRILIPPPLRQRAGLDKKVVLSGMGNKFELWSQEAWDAINAEDAEALRADGLDLNGALESLAI